MSSTAAALRCPGCYRHGDTAGSQVLVFALWSPTAIGVGGIHTPEKATAMGGLEAGTVGVRGGAGGWWRVESRSSGTRNTKWPRSLRQPAQLHSTPSGSSAPAGLLTSPGQQDSPCCGDRTGVRGGGPGGQQSPGREVEAWEMARWVLVAVSGVSAATTESPQPPGPSQQPHALRLTSGEPPPHTHTHSPPRFPTVGPAHPS